jgi:hypothetical protein
MLTLVAGGLAVAWSGLAEASPELQAQIEAGCRMSTNWSEAACACVADQAASLNDLQQGFLAATMNQQQAQVAQYGLQMTQAETMQASMFLATAGPACQ